MSMIRKAFVALIAVSALAFNNVSHAETPDAVEGQPDQATMVVAQTRSTLGAIFDKITTPLISIKDMRCLAKNIFYEAASEPEEGKVAVGVVTLNRLEDGRFGSSICKVVTQPKQFSWVALKNRAPKETDPRWIESQRIAQELVQGDDYDALKVKYVDALYFHNHTVRPTWARQKVRLNRVGLHTFYGESLRL